MAHPHRVFAALTTTNAQGVATCALQGRRLDVVLVLLDLGDDVAYAGTADFHGSAGTGGL
jgi:hypothetical protein